MRMSVRPPKPRQNLKALGCVRSLDYFGRQSLAWLSSDPWRKRAPDSRRLQQFLQERIAPGQRLEDQYAAVAVLNIGRMNQRVQQ